MRHIIIAVTIFILAGCGPVPCDSPECDATYTNCRDFAMWQCRENDEIDMDHVIGAHDEALRESCEAGVIAGARNSECRY